MADPLPKAGKRARFSVDGTYMAVEEWSAEEENSSPDTTSTEGGGVEDLISGTAKLSGSVKCFFDVANCPFASPPNITPGAYLDNVYHWRDASTNLLTVKKIMVKKVRAAMQVKDKIMFDFDWQAKCTYDGTAAWTWNTANST